MNTRKEFFSYGLFSHEINRNGVTKPEAFTETTQPVCIKVNEQDAFDQEENVSSIREKAENKHEASRSSYFTERERAASVVKNKSGS